MFGETADAELKLNGLNGEMRNFALIFYCFVYGRHQVVIFRFDFVLDTSTRHFVHRKFLKNSK